MEITDIRIRRMKAPGKMKAVASVTFDDVFVVHDMKIIEGNEGMFIAMPSRKTKSGEYKDVAHPLVTEMRQMLHDKIMEAYNNMPEDEDGGYDDEE